jgi:small subunit ribosomal protein S20
MAHSRSAKKRIRQNVTRRAVNRWRTTRVKTSVKDYTETLLHGTVEQAEQKLKALYKLLDQVAASGTLHKNTASRYKGRLAARLNAKRSAKPAA